MFIVLSRLSPWNKTSVFAARSYVRIDADALSKSEERWWGCLRYIAIALKACRVDAFDSAMYMSLSADSLKSFMISSDAHH